MSRIAFIWLLMLLLALLLSACRKNIHGKAQIRVLEQQQQFHKQIHGDWLVLPVMLPNGGFIADSLLIYQAKKMRPGQSISSWDSTKARTAGLTRNIWKALEDSLRQNHQVPGSLITSFCLGHKAPIAWSTFVTSVEVFRPTESQWAKKLKIKAEAWNCLEGRKLAVIHSGSIGEHAKKKKLPSQGELLETALYHALDALPYDDLEATRQSL